RSYFSPANTIPRHSRRKNSSVVKSEIRTGVTMADRTMEELLQAPSEGYGEAIVIPEILAENFEIKTNLLHVMVAVNHVMDIIVNHKLLKDLKELAEYDQSTNTGRPIFLNDNHPENSSEENVEPPQDSDIHQLIKECSVEVPEEQKQKMEDTMFDLVKICHHKQFLCIHDDIDNLIESALDSKLLSINSIKSQRLDKKEQEVKIVEEQQAERRNRIEKSLQNFREVALILSTKEPENSLSMGYEHLSITLETESDEVTESNAENLLPIPSECEVALEDKRECIVPIFENFPDCDNHSDTFSDSKINDDILVYDDDFEDIERLINLVENNNSDSSNAPLLEEVDLFLSDNSIPSGIENFADDPEGDIRFLEELLIDNSILSHESSDSNFEDNPSISRSPPEPRDDNFDLEPEVISAVMEDNNEPYEYFNPGGEIFVSTNIEDVDYFPFMFVI
nr:reverse transcriptase domain-containing protein [Tanacetum cinerariifolium]